MISLIFLSILVAGYSVCVAFGIVSPPQGMDANTIEIGATVISLSTFSISTLLFVWMLWVPSPTRLVLSSVRLCQTLALFNLFGPMSLFGYDTLKLNNELLGEFAFQKAGGSAIVGVIVCLYFLKRFQKMYIITHKEEYG